MIEVGGSKLIKPKPFKLLFFHPFHFVSPPLFNLDLFVTPVVVNWPSHYTEIMNVGLIS